MKKILLLLFLLYSSLFSKTTITVLYPFQEYFINKIALNKVLVRTVFSVDKPFNKDDKSLIDDLAFSRHYFSINLPKEQEILKILKNRNSELKVFDSYKDIAFLKDNKGNLNPYFWLDPLLARKYATNIYEKLIDIRSYDKEYLTYNYKNFLKELDDIYLDLKKRIDSSDSYGFLALSNKFDYFAKRFRLNVFHRDNRTIHLSEVSDFIKFSQKENIKQVINEKGNNYHIPQSYAGHINGTIIEIDIYEKDWRLNIYTFVRRLKYL